jgi:hypothetical protein
MEEGHALLVQLSDLVEENEASRYHMGPPGAHMATDSTVDAAFDLHLSQSWGLCTQKGKW